MPVPSSLAQRAKNFDPATVPVLVHGRLMRSRRDVVVWMGKDETYSMYVNVTDREQWVVIVHFS